VKTAQQAHANWTGSAGRAQADYVSGIQNSQKDQAALAVAAESRLVAGFNEAVASGRWRAGILRGGTPYWKTQSAKKAGNYATGYQAGSDNYAAAAQKVMAAIAQGVANLPPRGDIAQNFQRTVTLGTYLHGLKGQLGAKG
jgi:hypothetical protein